MVAVAQMTERLTVVQKVVGLYPISYPNFRYSVSYTAQQAWLAGGRRLPDPI